MYRQIRFARRPMIGAEHRRWAASSKHHSVGRLTRLLVALALAGLAAGVPAAAIEILQPLPSITESPDLSADGAVAETMPRDSKPYIRRVGRVRFDTDVFMPAAPSSGRRSPVSGNFQGQALGLALFDDTRFEVNVDAASRPHGTTLNLQGRLANQSVATFTLTVTADGYLMTLQDLDSGRLYRVVGDTDGGDGRVTEIDLTKMPPVIDAAPMVPAGR